MRYTRLLAALLILFPAAGLGCRHGARPAPVTAPTPAEQGPRLLLLLVVDQAGHDDLIRFRPLLNGGLERLLREGVSFSNAHHSHAVTATAVGHAALSTGLHPSRNGIIGNQWYDRENRQDAYCVGDPEFHRSPRNLLAPTLADWIKARDGRSRVYGASGKDRSAVLLAGQEAEAAFWYSRPTGELVSSSYYTGVPDWVAGFNAEKRLDAYFGQAWEPLPVSAAQLEAVGITQLDEGLYADTFPHSIGGLALQPDARFYNSLFGTPFTDVHLGAFARTLVERENLGGGESLDVLALSFSAPDIVGHGYGPHSREYLDALLRLDRTLGELLDFLDARIGAEKMVIAFSSDHGVLPLPEQLRQEGRAGHRLGAGDITCLQSAGRKLDSELGDADWLMSGGYLDYDTLAAEGRTRQEVETVLAAALEACDAVETVWTRTQIETGTGDDSPYRELYVHGFHRQRSGDLFVQYREFHLPMPGKGTSHGSPYAYDTHVPLIIVAPGITPGEIEKRVRTVDLAPTLATLLGVAAPDDLDGKDLSDLLR